MKEFEKKMKWNFSFFFVLFISIFKSFKSPASGKKNVQFLNSPDFDNNCPDFRTGRDIR